MKGWSQIGLSYNILAMVHVFFIFPVMVREQRGQKESLLTVSEMMGYILATPAPHVYSTPLHVVAHTFFCTTTKC